MTTATETTDRLAAAMEHGKKPKSSRRMELVGVETHKRAILAAIKACRPALLIGGAATGKSTLAQECAYELGRRYYRINLSGYVTPDQLIGRPMARAKDTATETFFQYGIIVRAMREGAVLILDEVNAALPDTLFCLHAVLEANPRLYVPETEEEILPKEGFCVIGTMNPSHEYAGTRELNAAFYSRFEVVLRFNELEGSELMKALRMHAPAAISDNQILFVCKVLEEARKARSTDKISTRVTLRECIGALRLMTELNDTEAVSAAILNKLNDEERGELPCVSSAPTLPPSKSLVDLLKCADRVSELQTQLDKANEELKALGKLRELLSAFSSVKAAAS